MNIIGCDPSVNHLGLVRINSEIDEGKGAITYCKTLEAPATLYKGSDTTRLRWMIAEFGGILYSLNERSSLDALVIERPQSWGSYKSVASEKSGALLLLHILVGALWQCAEELTTAHLIPVSEWKGQLPKEETQARMEKKYNYKFKTDHEADACGIADYFLMKGLAE
jgi:hypothetical protein